MLAVAGGLAFPGADAAAQSAQGGYTYTQQFCQEYGKQPRYYGVRDGQAAYNGGNSDSGWLIVLEQGRYNVGTADRYVLDLSLGRYEGYIRYRDTTPDTYFPAEGRLFFTRLYSNNFVFNPTGGARVRIPLTPWNVGDPTPDSDFYIVGTTRYRRIPGIPARGGGQYVRWANIMWCQ